jgi:Flp pilus assembly pilin Flp
LQVLTVIQTFSKKLVAMLRWFIFSCVPTAAPSSMNRTRGTLLRLLQEETAQDTLEYLLVVGAVSVAVVIGLSLGFKALVPQVLNHLCSTVDPLEPSGCF